MNTPNETRTDFVVRNLRAIMPKNWPEIARATGVPFKTIYKIAYRETKNPRENTVDPLYRHFNK